MVPLDVPLLFQLLLRAHPAVTSRRGLALAHAQLGVLQRPVSHFIRINYELVDTTDLIERAHDPELSATLFLLIVKLLELEIEDEEADVLAIAEQRLRLVPLKQVAHDRELAVLLLITIVQDVVDEAALAETALVVMVVRGDALDSLEHMLYPFS